MIVRCRRCSIPVPQDDQIEGAVMGGGTEELLSPSLQLKVIARVANYEWDVNVELMDMEVFDADTSWCSEPSLVVESLLLQLSVLTIDYH